MTTYMDYRISPKPIRDIFSRVDKSRLLLTSLRILGVGHIPGRTLYRREAKFMHFAVVYIGGGEGHYRVNGGDVQPVREGSLFFFYPGASFDYGPPPGSSWDEYFFTVEGPRIEEWLRDWIGNPGTVRQVGSIDGYRQKIERIFLLMDSGIPSDQDRASLQLEALLYEFMLQARSVRETERTNHAAKLLEDLVHSVYGEFDPNRVCERNHISLSTLRRLVHKISGYPLHEYIHRLKIAEAKHLLLNTDAKVKELAEKLGYKDMFYFSRIFKKITGVSPRDYRKSL